MDPYFRITLNLKKYIKEVDKLWYERYHNFITHLKDKKDFNPILVAQNSNTNIIQLLQDSDLVEFLDVFVCNPNVNCQLLNSMSDVEWNLTLFPQNSYISIEFIVDNIKKYNFNWHSLSANPYFTMKDITFYERLPWNFKGVCYNPNLDLYYVKLFHEQGKKLDWHAISKHPNIMMEDIKKNSKYPWDTDGMCLNPNLSTEFIKSNPGVKWNYMLLSENPAIKLRFIFKNLDKPWCWVKISSHPRLTIGIIQKFPKLGWNWYQISANPAFNLEIVRKYHNYPWSYKGFSKNPNIDMSAVLSNLKIGWDFNELCSNTFDGEKNKFYAYELRKYFMSKKIVKFWRSRVQDTNYAIGRKIQSDRYNKAQQSYEDMYDEEGAPASSFRPPLPPRNGKTSTVVKVNVITKAPPRPTSSKPPVPKSNRQSRPYTPPPPYQE
jgi:hypothetical protein